MRSAGRDLDWLKLRDFLAGPKTGRQLIEMVVYVGLPPAMVSLADDRERKTKFVNWLRTHGFMVVTKDGAPTEEGRYKANVDIMMAIDVLDLSIEMQPDVVILVTGDADFAHLVTKLRRRGIRVEVASIAQHLGQMLKSAANHVIELGPLFQTFEKMNAADVNRARMPQQTGARSAGQAATPRPARQSPAPARPSTPQNSRQQPPPQQRRGQPAPSQRQPAAGAPKQQPSGQRRQQPRKDSGQSVGGQARPQTAMRQPSQAAHSPSPRPNLPAAP